MITANFQEGTAASVNIASFLQNPHGHVIAYSVIGTLPTGVTFAGTLLSYNGTSAGSNGNVQFRATSGSYSAESALTLVRVVVPASPNIAPIWQGSNPINLGSGVQGVAAVFPLAGKVSDTDGPLPLVFSRTGGVLDTAPGSVTQQASSPANLTFPASLTAVGGVATTYTVEISAEDGFGLVAKVTGLTATAASSSQINLAWIDVANEVNYEVQRSPNGSTGWATIATPTAGTVVYLDTGLTALTPYFYRVRGSNAAGQGVYSDIAMATTTSGATSSDWSTRSAGAGVVWAHRFDTESEVLAFLKIAQNAPDTYASLGSNSVCTLAHDPIVRGAQWVTDQKVSGVGALKVTNIGTLLAANTVGFPTIVAGGTSQISVVDAQDFPDPSPTKSGTQALADMVAASAYPSAAYCVDINDPIAVDAESGSKGKRERVAVIKVDKTTNTLYVRRGLSYGEMTTGGGQNPKTFTTPGRTAIGQDCDGGWCRPFSAVEAGDNGLTTDDPAAGGAVPVHNNWNAASPGTSISTWDAGYYAHTDYHALNWSALAGITPEFEGTEFWLQFRFRLSASRYDGLNDWTDVGGDATMGVGKLFFVATTGSVDLQEITATTGAARPQFTIYTNKGLSPGLFEEYISGNEFLQPGGPYQIATCNSTNRAGCWSYPTDEWVTLQFHVIPGHHFEHRIPHNTLEPSVTLTVDAGGTNDGTHITFTVDAPPEYRYGVVSRSAADYFKGYQIQALQTAGGSGNVSIESSSVSGGKLTLSCIRRATATLPAGAPTAGQTIVVVPFQTQTNTVSVDAVRHVPTFVDVKVKRAIDPTWVTLNNSSVGHHLIFGDGQGNPANHPYAYNAFQPTGYQNVQDNAVPPAKTYSYWFDEVIFSRAVIPAPIE